MGKISFTIDMWTDLNKTPYMAVTAHWLEQVSLQQQKVNLCTDLISFVHVPGTHTGKHLAEVFLWVIDYLKLDKKIRFLILY